MGNRFGRVVDSSLGLGKGDPGVGKLTSKGPGTQACVPAPSQVSFHSGPPSLYCWLRLGACVGTGPRLPRASCGEVSPCHVLPPSPVFGSLSGPVSFPSVFLPCCFSTVSLRLLLSLVLGILLPCPSVPPSQSLTPSIHASASLGLALFWINLQAPCVLAVSPWYHPISQTLR